MNLNDSRLKQTMQEGIPVSLVTNFLFVLTYATSVGLNGLIGILFFLVLVVGNVIGFYFLGKKNSNFIEIFGYSLITFVSDIALVSVLYLITNTSFDKVSALLSLNLGVIVVVNLIVRTSVNSVLKKNPIVFEFSTKEIETVVSKSNIPKEALFPLYNNNPKITKNMIDRILMGYPLDDKDIVKLIHIGTGYSELDSWAKNFIDCKQALRKMYVPIVNNYLTRTDKEIQSELSIKAQTNEAIISMAKENMKED